MATLDFYQLYPYQPLPKLASGASYAIPKRAAFFCHPFKLAAKKGVYAFAPFDFSVLVTDAYLDFKAVKADGSLFEKRVEKKPSAANFVLLSDIDAQRSEECLTSYRSRLKSHAIPNFIDVETFGFYEIMVNIIVEEDPFDFYLQIWLGGTLHLDGDGQISIKHATNVLHDAGFICLDADVDTDMWQGWLAIVVKPTRKNDWIHFNKDTPICQIVGTNQAIEKLSCHAYKEVSNEQFCKPLDWHLFDPNYVAKPGKYQRQIRQKEKKTEK